MPFNQPKGFDFVNSSIVIFKEQKSEDFFYNICSSKPFESTFKLIRNFNERNVVSQINIKKLLHTTYHLVYALRFDIVISKHLSNLVKVPYIIIDVQLNLNIHANKV